VCLSWSIAISWMCLRSWRGHGCSIQTGVQSTHWLNVRSRPLRSAWQFGDVSCKSVPYPLVLISEIGMVLVTFSIPEYTEAIVVSRIIGFTRVLLGRDVVVRFHAIQGRPEGGYRQLD